MQGKKLNHVPPVRKGNNNLDLELSGPMFFKQAKPQAKSTDKSAKQTAIVTSGRNRMATADKRPFTVFGNDGHTISFGDLPAEGTNKTKSSKTSKENPEQGHQVLHQTQINLEKLQKRTPGVQKTIHPEDKIKSKKRSASAQQKIHAVNRDPIFKNLRGNLDETETLDLSKEQIFFKRPIYTLESKVPIAGTSSLDGPLNLQTSGIVSQNFDSRESYDYVHRDKLRTNARKGLAKKSNAKQGTQKQNIFSQKTSGRHTADLLKMRDPTSAYIDAANGLPTVAEEIRPNKIDPERSHNSSFSQTRTSHFTDSANKYKSYSTMSDPLRGVGNYVQQTLERTQKQQKSDNSKIYGRKVQNSSRLVISSGLNNEFSFFPQARHSASQTVHAAIRQVDKKSTKEEQKFQLKKEKDSNSIKQQQIRSQSPFQEDENYPSQLNYVKQPARPKSNTGYRPLMSTTQTSVKRHQQSQRAKQDSKIATTTTYQRKRNASQAKQSSAPLTKGCKKVEDVQQELQQYLDSNLQQNFEQQAHLNQTTANVLAGHNKVMKAQMTEQFANQQQGFVDPCQKQDFSEKKQPRSQSASRTTVQKAKHETQILEPYKYTKRPTSSTGVRRRGSTIQTKNQSVFRAELSPTKKLAQVKNLSDSVSGESLHRRSGKVNLGTEEKKHRGTSKNSASSDGVLPWGASQKGGPISGRRTVEYLLAGQLKNNVGMAKNQTILIKEGLTVPVGFESEPQMQALAQSTLEIPETMGSLNKDQSLINDIREHIEDAADDDKNKTSKISVLNKTQILSDKESSMQLQGLKANLGLTHGKNTLNKKPSKTKIETKVQPEKNTQKVNKIIKENLKRYKDQIEATRTLAKVKEEQQRQKRYQIEQQNERIRKINKEQLRQKKPKSKELEGPGADMGVQKLSQTVKRLESRLKPTGQRPKTAMQHGQQTDCRSGTIKCQIDLSRHDDDERAAPDSFRRSNFGLDFIDLRKEINGEIKTKTSQLKTSLSQKNISQFKKIKQVRNPMEKSSQLEGFMGKIYSRYHEVQEKRRGRKLNINIVVQTQQQETSPQQSQGLPCMQTAATQALLQEIQEEPRKIKQENIKKFMQKKRKQVANEKVKEKAQEIEMAKQVQINLIKLNKYIVKKQKPIQTSGINCLNSNTSQTDNVSFRLNALSMGQTAAPNNLVFKNKSLSKKKNMTTLKSQMSKRLKPQHMNLDKNTLDFTIGEHTVDGSDQNKTKGGIFCRNIANSTIGTVQQDDFSVNDWNEDQTCNRSKTLTTSLKNQRKVLVPDFNLSSVGTGKNNQRIKSNLGFKNKEKETIAQQSGTGNIHQNKSSASSSKYASQSKMCRSPIHSKQGRNKLLFASVSSKSAYSPITVEAVPEKQEVEKKQKKKRPVSPQKRVNLKQQKAKPIDGQAQLSAVNISKQSGQNMKADQKQKKTKKSIKSVQSSPDYFYERVDSGERHRSRTLVKLSKEGAAVMIQKFVKQHLKQKGFYQQESVHSPERDPCINLYINKERYQHQQLHNQNENNYDLQRNKTHKNSSQKSKSHQNSKKEFDQLKSISDKPISEQSMQVVRAKTQNKRQPQKEIQVQNRPIVKAKVNELTQSSLEESLAQSSYQQQAVYLNPNQAEPKKILQKVKNKAVKHKIGPKAPILQLHRIEQKGYAASVTPQSDLQKSHSREMITQSSKEYQQLRARKVKDDHSIGGNPPNYPLRHINSQRSMESGSQKSQNSLFDRNSFQKMSRKKLIDLMQNNEYKQMIKIREDWLEFKEKKEKKAISKLLKNNELTPRTYDAKKEKIERWVRIQKQDIEKTKQAYQEEWDKTVQMIDETQRNVNDVREKLNYAKQQPSNVTSKTSGVKSFQSGLQSKLRSNSDISGDQNSQKPVYQNGKQSILIEDPPKSYRSGGTGQEGRSGSSKFGPQSQGIISSTHFSASQKGNQNEEQKQGQLQQVTLDFGDLNVENIELNSVQANKQDLEPSSNLITRLEQMNKNDIQPLNSEVLDLKNLLPDLPGSSSKDHHSGQSQSKEAMVINDDFELEDQPQFSILQKRIAAQQRAEDQSQSAKSVSLVEAHNQSEAPESSDQQNGQAFIEVKREEESAKNSLNNSSSLDEPQIISGQSQPLDMDVKQQDSQSAEKPEHSLEDLDLDALLLSLEDHDQREDVSDVIVDTLMQSLIGEITENLPIDRSQQKKKEEVREDVYIVDSFQNVKEERREYIEAYHRHLIERELIQSDSYISEMVERLLLYEIDSSEGSQPPSAREGQITKQKSIPQFSKASPQNLHIQFLQNLTQPIFRNASITLKSMQSRDPTSYQHFETAMHIHKFPIIPVDLYLEVERLRDESDRKDSTRLNSLVGPKVELSLVQESSHIENKCYFDALNESLMKFRPYGVTGEPMPWSTKIRRLQTKVDINSVDTERLFQMVKHDVFRWASAFCGSVPNPDYFPAQKNGKKDKLNEELFQETRDKRLSQVLQAETIEQEHHWLNFEYEETQVKLELSDVILDSLVSEIACLLNGEKIEPKKPSSGESGTEYQIVSSGFQSSNLASMFRSGENRKFSTQQNEGMIMERSSKSKELTDMSIKTPQTFSPIINH